MVGHLRAESAADALALAVQRRRPPVGLLHHTDRGCQYTAALYQPQLASADLVCSMSRVWDCYDHALAERCFATLEAELIDIRPGQTRAAARTAIFAWLAVWYNRQRRHAAVNYQPPIAYEERMMVLSCQPTQR